MITTNEQQIIDMAFSIIEREYRSGTYIGSADGAKRMARLKLATLEREAFGVFFLDSQHHLIEFEVLFYGTINRSSVHVREIIKSALKHNAAAVVFAHNHPGGSLDASLSDKHLTINLRDVLELVDVRVVDHVIVTCDGEMSFAQTGLL